MKGTVLLLLTLLIKARIRITVFSAIGMLLLTLQTLLFLVVSGGMALTAAGALLYARRTQQSAVA